MKSVLLAALAMCAVMISCSNEDNNIPGGAGDKTGEKITVLVKLPGNTVTRSVEAPVSSGSLSEIQADADKYLTTVFLLNGNAVVSAHNFESNEFENGKRIELVPSSVNGVMVVANLPVADTAAVKALTNVIAIEKYGFTIVSQSATGISDKLLMGKSSTVVSSTPIGTDDGHNYKEYAVSLNSITARFEIGNVTKGEGIANIKLEGVWINNYLRVNAAAELNLNESDSEFWKTTAVAITGSDTDLQNPTIINEYDPVEYYDKFDSQVNGTDMVYAYSLFCGEYVPHVIVLVSGEYEEGHYTGADKYFLGWLTYSKFTDESGADITSVDPNLIYKVGLGGITVDAKDITTLPELQQFDLGVRVDIVKWIEKNVTPGVQ